MSEQANQPLGDVAFTHSWYRQFLQRLLADGYEFQSFTDRLGEGDIVLRHDVDLSVDRAVEMARIEAEMGIESSYFVLLASPLYNPFEADCREALNEIASLGHDVGLHFSTHLYWTAEDSPTARAIERYVSQEQAVLDTVVPTTETVSFHRPPSWVLDRSFGGVRSTYDPAFFSDIGYLADSTQRWRETPPRMDALPETMQLLTHPGLWAAEDGDFDHRVEEAITAACRHTGRRTRAEFSVGETDV